MVLNACKELHKTWSKFKYGIPINGKISNIPTAHYYYQHYKFLSPHEFEKVGGGVCWDYVEYGSDFLRKKGIQVRTFYILTDTPPNYDTHTILVCEVNGKYIYPESSFGLVDKDMKGIGIFNSLEEIFQYVTSWMFECNNNKKKFKSFKYYVYEYTSAPHYGASCEEYMDYMHDHGNIIFQGIATQNKRKTCTSVDDLRLKIYESEMNHLISIKERDFLLEKLNDKRKKIF